MSAPVDHDLHLRKMDAEIAKLHAETVKILTEAKWFPFVAVAGVFAAAAALVKLLGS